MSQRRILHLHSSFDAGGKEVRCVRLINAFGAEFSHTIISAQPGALAAGKLISGAVAVDYPADFPPLAGSPLPARLKGLARAMRGFDLVLSYNWGAMDAVMAHRLFAPSMGLAPLIHHEDGFNSDEAERLKIRRNLYRRLALRRASGLVVPSFVLERIAREVWHQPAHRVHRIANGIPTAAYAVAPPPDAVPGLVKREGEKWLGTLAGLRAVKDLPAMVRAFAPLPSEWRLVILGEGPEREAIMAEARRLGVAERVQLPGFAPDPAKVVGLFDIFALSSKSEQFPISVVEAMAAGLPVAAPGVGDVAQMVAPANEPFIVPPGDDAALADAITALAADPERRREVGAANREKARNSYDEGAMLAAYRALYQGAMAGKIVR
ncbi:MAG TPA: glycosyltransferase [Sphingomonadaceae bacterium]|nr:glycosyltransferase [Sphingomonadaceae bacterium]